MASGPAASHRGALQIDGYMTAIHCKVMTLHCQRLCFVVLLSESYLYIVVLLQREGYMTAIRSKVSILHCQRLGSRFEIARIK